jgi:hypothetical protein
VWELFLVEKQCDNVQSKLQIFKLTSLSLFPSQLMKFLHMPKELNGYSDHVFSHWFQTAKFPHRCGHEDHTMKEAWKGKAQPNKDLI